MIIVQNSPTWRVYKTSISNIKFSKAPQLDEMFTLNLEQD